MFGRQDFVHIACVHDNIQHELAEWCRWHRVLPDALDVAGWNGVSDAQSLAQGVDGAVLEARNDELVTEQPKFDQLACIEIVTVSIGEAASIEELVEDVEDFNVFVDKRQLSLGGLDEGAVESTAKEVRVEGEEILVDHELFLFVSDLDRDERLETGAAKRVS